MVSGIITDFNVVQFLKALPNNIVTVYSVSSYSTEDGIITSPDSGTVPFNNITSFFPAICEYCKPSTVKALEYTLKAARTATHVRRQRLMSRFNFISMKNFGCVLTLCGVV